MLRYWKGILGGLAAAFVAMSLMGDDAPYSWKQILAIAGPGFGGLIQYQITKPKNEEVLADDFDPDWEDED